MSEDDLEPLSAEALSMLAIERDRPDAPDDVPGRVFEHLATSVAVGGGPAGGGGGGGAGAAPVAGGLARTLGGLMAAAIVGGGIGAMVHARVAAPPVESVAAIASANASASASASANASAIAIASASVNESASARPLASSPIVAAPTSSAIVPRGVGSARDVDLGMERALVERARMASAHGDGAEALEALDKHAREFPRGRLTEEREALAVQALVQAGRLDEARARAARFRARFPSSVFLGSVNAALGAAP